MSANKGKDTKPELMLRLALCEAGYPGYRLHWNVPGRPDICYLGRKVAIFVNGCFWHRCPRCKLQIPRSNVEFWREKFDANKERDARKRLQLEEDGWSVLTFWECELKEDIQGCIEKVRTHERFKDPLS